MKRVSRLTFGLMLMIFAGFVFLIVNQSFAACPDGMTAYWKLDETAGPTYTDYVGGNNGTGNVDPAAATGIVNGAQSFDGSTTGIDVPASRTFNWLSTDSFSIELWTKIEGGVPLSLQVLIGRIDADSALQWWIGVNTAGNADFHLVDAAGNGPATIIGTSNIADGSWHHIVAVRDESTNTDILYVDGVEEGSAVYDYPAGFCSGDKNLNIGYLNPAPSNNFAGLIDEVALYDRALSQSNIQDHYNAGVAGKGVQTLRPEPVADAGADQTVTVGDKVTLDGSGSADADGNIVTYLWEQTSGTTVTLSGANTAKATFTAPSAAATLTFRLTVTDNDGQSTSDQTTVTVKNASSTPSNPSPTTSTSSDSGGGGGGCFISSLF